MQSILLNLQPRSIHKRTLPGKIKAHWRGMPEAFSLQESAHPKEGAEDTPHDLCDDIQPPFGPGCVPSQASGKCDCRVQVAPRNICCDVHCRTQHASESCFNVSNPHDLICHVKVKPMRGNRDTGTAVLHHSWSRRGCGE